MVKEPKMISLCEMTSAAPPAEIRSSTVIIPLITAIIVALCALLYWQTGRLREQQNWVSHSYQVKLEIEELDRSLREAESMQRAMLLSGGGGVALQKNFSSLLSAVRGHFDNLEYLVDDNPAQLKLVEEFSILLMKRLITLEQNARELINSGESERAARMLRGVAEGDAVEQSLERIRASEAALLNERSEGASASASTLFVLATGGSTLGLAVMLLAFVQERRNGKLRERYQERLAEARDTALDSVQATSIFVASVSHEIRTPMNGVLGAADLLQQDRRLDRRQRELVETIRSSGEALLDLINDILDLSKLQAGKMDFVTEDFSLTEVLDETLNLFSQVAGRKSLELAHRIDPDIPGYLRGDARRLRQVLVNLVGNAVKFTDQGSVLVEVDQRAGDKGRPVLRFRVVDTGPGISAEEQEQLFIPFSQVNAALSRRHRGTGLGLAISREIVQRLSGTMGLESTPSSGSAFWFTAVFEDAETREDSCGRLCNGGTLLLIEGRDLTTGSIVPHVQAWGMQVVTAPDLDALRSLPPLPNLAAVVIGQPLGASWRNIADEVAKRRDGGQSRRFLLSYPHEQPLEDELASGGIEACLRFPFRPSDLYNLLAEEGKAPASEDIAVALASARVLLVEDNLTNQRVFSRQLEALGLMAEIRGDGHEGVAARMAGVFDVILMDCQLPTMDGFEATRRIRAWEVETGATRIPIIAVTAHVMTGDAEACYQAGMDDYLSKPFDLAKLRRKLEPWLSEQKAKNIPKVLEVLEVLEVLSPIRVLDVKQLNECITGDIDWDCDLIGTALEETLLRRAEMERALLNGNDAEWRAASHRAVGSAATLGFGALAAELRASEQDDGDEVRRKEALARIDDLVRRTREELAALGLSSAAVGCEAPDQAFGLT